MTTNGNVQLPNNKQLLAKISYDYKSKLIVFSSKPAWIIHVFGMIGDALAPLKERFRLNTDDIQHIEITRKKLGATVYTLSLTDNTTCTIRVGKDDALMEMLASDLKEKVTDNR